MKDIIASNSTEKEKEYNMSLPKIQLVNVMLLSDLNDGQGGYCLERAKKLIKNNPELAGQLHAFFKPDGAFRVPVWRENGVLHFGTPGEKFPKS
jgi:hypothetical protein